MRTNKYSRYIFDPLYGPIFLPDFIWDIFLTPEIQRLREVRLCNINSLCLTGGANINRFEHAIGTYHLANECLKSWPPLNPIFEDERKIFLIAALLHDTTSAAFGHSVEYIESIKGFDHEHAFEDVILNKGNSEYQYKFTSLDPIYFGMLKELSTLLSVEDVKKIGNLIAGKGRFGPLINSNIDLDNIDNVFRMAYHVGLIKSGKIALNLAKSLYIDKDELIIRNDGLKYVEIWHELRKKLYKLLLLNPDEFSAKYMFSEAIELAITKKEIPFAWYHVDFELIDKLHNLTDFNVYYLREYTGSVESKNFNYFNNNDDFTILKNTILKNSLKYEYKKITNYAYGYILEINRSYYYVEYNDDILKIYKAGLRSQSIKDIVLRLMKGNLYGCFGIYSTNKTNFYEDFRNIEKRNIIENKLSLYVKNNIDKKYDKIIYAIHPIIDVNKTERQIEIKTENKLKKIIGNKSNQLLLGIFSKNLSYNMNNVAKIPNKEIKLLQENIYKFLSLFLKDDKLKTIERYSELNEI